MQTIKKMVLAQLSIDPTISLKACQQVVVGLKKSNFYKIKRERNIPSEPSEQKNNQASGSAVKPSTTLPLEYKDDPDELLMSVSIRQLNQPNPDPRWATILIAAKKAKITTKGNDVELQRLSVNSLVQMLRESLPQELSKEESNSLLDNSQNQLT